MKGSHAQVDRFCMENWFLYYKFHYSYAVYWINVGGKFEILNLKRKLVWGSFWETELKFWDRASQTFIMIIEHHPKKASRYEPDWLLTAMKHCSLTTFWLKLSFQNKPRNHMQLLLVGCLGRCLLVTDWADSFTEGDIL